MQYMHTHYIHAHACMHATLGAAGTKTPRRTDTYSVRTSTVQYVQVQYTVRYEYSTCTVDVSA